MSTPLQIAVEGWPIGTFVKVPLPGPTTVDRIKEGRYGARFPYVNADAFSTLEAFQDGSGRIRALGWLAAAANRDTIDAKIRQWLEAILQQRRREAQRRSGKVLFLLAVGSFGGFGSGVHGFIAWRVRDIAGDLRIEIDFLRILLVPGTTPPKDPENSFGLTYAVMSELVACSSRSHWERKFLGEEHGSITARSVFVPTLVLSDTNNAPGQARALSIENFAGMVAELILTWITTDAGARLDAAGVDFAEGALRVTPAVLKFAECVPPALLRRMAQARFAPGDEREPLERATLLQVQVAGH